MEIHNVSEKQKSIMVIGMNCHDNKVIINCPMEGANTGTKINIELTRDISLANLVPE
tara:strand:- start:18 stop:188 length:171 start_codon:yes stop_codon:yes gene_type:complete